MLVHHGIKTSVHHALKNTESLVLKNNVPYVSYIVCDYNLGRYYIKFGTLKNNVDNIFDKTYCYPNPCLLSQRNATIMFHGLPDVSFFEFKIYDISRELIFSKIIYESYFYWDCKNQSNENIASGLYIYKISTPLGEKKIGKIAIIR
jgi:hypothetical protein